MEWRSCIASFSRTWFYVILPSIGQLSSTTKRTGSLRGAGSSRRIPALAQLITETIGDEWITDLGQLAKLEPFAECAAFQERFFDAKRSNKRMLAKHIRRELGISVSADSLFDVQVKRLHEYKRQLLLLLYIIVRYERLKRDPALDMVPRTFIVSAKAAPGYVIAKLIIKLINQVAEVINRDPQVCDKLKVVFLPNYRVSLAEKIIPAADLSEQISLAGTEASGTGNMKLQLNGALTIGTLDGANVEIMEEVGKDNIFIFGLTAQEVEQRRASYNPREIYNNDEEIRRAIDLIDRNFFNMLEPGIFEPLTQGASFQRIVICYWLIFETTSKHRTKWTWRTRIVMDGSGRRSSTLLAPGSFPPIALYRNTRLRSGMLNHVTLWGSHCAICKADCRM